MRLPQQSDCLTSIDFDLIPNKPPPDVRMFDEEVEEVEESASEEEDEDEDMEPATIPHVPQPAAKARMPEPVREEAPFPISAIPTPADMAAAANQHHNDDGSDAGEDDDDLFAGGEDDDESDAMEEVQTALGGGAMKRKLVEEDDYD